MSLNSYIAGLNLPFALTETQALNGLAWTATFGMLYSMWPNSKFLKQVEREGGQVVEMPPGKRGEFVTAVHAVGFFGPALAFLVSLPVNKFVTPRWMLESSLPPTTSNEVYAGLRIGACVGTVGVGLLSTSTIKHLSSQWHFVGLRERPKLVNTGPYAFVRHPLYLCGILFGAFSTAMFWNWIPLAGTCLAIPAFIVKIPMEEKVLLSNKQMGSAYKRYRKEVPWRVIPYVW